MQGIGGALERTQGWQLRNAARDGGRGRTEQEAMPLTYFQE
jgi:hypothetical protein